MQQRFGHDSASVLPRPPKPYAVSVQVAKLTDRLAKLEGKFESPNSKGQLQGPRKLILGTGSSRERLFAEAMAVLARQQTQALEALKVEAQAREKQQSASIAASREQDAGLADQEAQLACPENQRSTTQISQSASAQACKEFSSEHIVRSRLKGA